MIDSSRAFTKLVAAFNQNDWPRVQHHAGELLALAPGDARVHFMAGVACLERQQWAGALEHLLQATRLEPRRADYAAQHAKALAQLQRMPEARQAADRAMSLAPDDAWTLDTLGVIYLQAHAPAQAATAFRRTVALLPGHAPAHFKLAHVLTALDDVEGAERELEACIRLEPRHWPAHLRLAELRPQTLGRNHLARLRALLQQHAADPAAQTFLNIALGKECEDTGDYPAAFAHYARGKAAGRRQRPYDFARDEAMFDALVRAFPLGQAGAPAGDPTHEPIFVVGLPRSGIALLDRLLSSHPDVHSAGELEHFPMLLQHASHCHGMLLREADIAAHTRHIDWQQLGAVYLASTRPATGHTPRFIDRLPHNFLSVGFIARALPNAKIVCLRRDPLDTCLANFRHLFEQASDWYNYSFDLADIGRYYLAFDRLMAHWHTLLPGRILEVSYESLVADPEASMRELLAWCGLPWHGAHRRPARNAAAANAPGARPPHTPIRHDAVGRWKHFKPQLDELRWMLAGAGIDTPP